jgi:hypothetical protein
MTGKHTMVILALGEQNIRYIFHQLMEDFKKDYEYQIMKNGYYKGYDNAGMSIVIYPKKVARVSISPW